MRTSWTTVPQAMQNEIMEETLRKRQSALAAAIDQNTHTDGVHATRISNLFLARSSEPTEPLHGLHEPALCIVAQGKKRVMLAEQLYLYGPDQCLVVSVDLPVVGHVLEATPAVSQSAAKPGSWTTQCAHYGNGPRGNGSRAHGAGFDVVSRRARIAR